jgi:ribosomal protein S18 acetylase RimI-like enzyme
MFDGEILLEATIKAVTKSSLRDIPEPCSHCIYWSFPEEFERRKSELSERKQELEAKKRMWIMQALRAFGSCGKILYRNNAPVGYTEYGPSKLFLNIKMYKSKSVGRIEDGIVFLSCLYITDKSLGGRGLGRRLLEAVLANLKKRGFKALETYAREGSAESIWTS